MSLNNKFANANANANVNQKFTVPQKNFITLLIEDSLKLLL